MCYILRIPCHLLYILSLLPFTLCKDNSIKVNLTWIFIGSELDGGCVGVTYSLIRFVLRDLSGFTHSLLQSICGAADLSIIRAGTANPTKKMSNKLGTKEWFTANDSYTNCESKMIHELTSQGIVTNTKMPILSALKEAVCVCGTSAFYLYSCVNKLLQTN